MKVVDIDENATSLFDDPELIDFPDLPKVVTSRLEQLPTRWAFKPTARLHEQRTKTFNFDNKEEKEEYAEWVSKGTKDCTHLEQSDDVKNSSSERVSETLCK